MCVYNKDYYCYYFAIHKVFVFCYVLKQRDEISEICE